MATPWYALTICRPAAAPTLHISVRPPDSDPLKPACLTRLKSRAASTVWFILPAQRRRQHIWPSPFLLCGLDRREHAMCSISHTRNQHVLSSLRLAKFTAILSFILNERTIGATSTQQDREPSMTRQNVTQKP